MEYQTVKGCLFFLLFSSLPRCLRCRISRGITRLFRPIMAGARGGVSVMWRGGRVTETRLWGLSDGGAKVYRKRVSHLRAQVITLATKPGMDSDLTSRWDGLGKQINSIMGDLLLELQDELGFAGLQTVVYWGGECKRSKKLTSIFTKTKSVQPLEVLKTQIMV